jgi:12-oxophytodienoic acid reductase
MAAQYYSERATNGALMISEGTIVSERGHGYPCTPGINTGEHVEKWKPICDAVHKKGAHFFCQLWHCGRASHQHYQPNEDLPLSSSAVAIDDGNKAFSLKSMQLEDYPVPRALEKEELPGIVEEFRVAARNAIEAGFDGVEIHGANGYLLDQFMKDGINQRTDEYGGSIENRCRFPLEVAKAVAEEIGGDRVGYRLSPFGGFLSAHDSHPYASVMYMVEELGKLDLAYIHMVEPRVKGNTDQEEDPRFSLEPFRRVWQGVFIASGGYTPENAREALRSGHCDAIAFGRWHLANPDFVKRAFLNAPLNPYHRDTFYTQGKEGYIDYPFLEDTEWGKEHAELVKAAAF